MIRVLDAFNSIWDVPLRDGGVVLDLGGGMKPHPKATYIIDWVQPNSDAIWIQWDLNDGAAWSMPFPDRTIDVVFCSQTLEDLRDPIGVLRAVQRISKYALLETPHWTHELSVVDTRPDWELICGYPHHRWLIGMNRTTMVYEFFAKQVWLVPDESYRPMKKNLCVEWDGDALSFNEITHEYAGPMLRKEFVHWLSGRWM